MSASPRRHAEESDLADLVGMLAGFGVRVAVERGRVVVAEGVVTNEAATILETLEGRERALRAVLANPDLCERVAALRESYRSKGRHRSAGTCKRGHDLTDPESVSTSPASGYRTCRACVAARRAAKAAKTQREGHE